MPFDCLRSKPKQNKLGQEILEIGKSWKISLMAAICGNRSKQNSVINDFKGRQHRNNSFICSKQVLIFPHSEQVKRIPPSRNSSFHHHFIIIIIIINIDFSISRFVLSFCTLEFHTFFLFTGKKDLIEKHKKSQVFQRFKRAETVQSESVIYLFIYLFILLHFLLLTSRLSKESSIWSLPC